MKTNAANENALTVTVPAYKQIVYLDFDGESTKYSNTDLGVNIDDVIVQNSGLSRERIQQITYSLNEEYAEKNILFVTERPEDEEYSTVYVGKTDAFDSCGEFYGLAETIDAGNQIKNDNAFVFADETWSNEDIISVVSHETGHITEGKKHDIETRNLADYADAVNSSQWLVDKTIDCAKDVPYKSTYETVTCTNSCSGSGTSFYSRSLYSSARYTFVNTVSHPVNITIKNTSSTNTLVCYLYNVSCNYDAWTLNSNTPRHVALVAEVKESGDRLWLKPGESYVFTNVHSNTRLFVGTGVITKNVKKTVFYDIAVTGYTTPKKSDLTIGSMSLSSYTILKVV